MPNTNVYEANYKRLTKVIDLEKIKEASHVKMKSSGFMNLNFDFLGAHSDGRISISMAHNYIQNGDVMADPDMVLLVDQKNETVEALTFQQDSLGIYQEVYTDSTMKQYYPRLKQELNAFLGQWLRNILQQGYLVPAAEPVANIGA
ncbi:MAG: DUF1249 domain-containing protein [Spirochaetes bacterium]|nr:DUF1249 domain-containing protein [Spirochaetota bacterium]